MGYLTKEQILASEDIETEEVDVPEWGGMVRVRGLNGQQRDRFEASLMERRGKRMVPNTENIRAKMVAWSVVDEKGERVFTEGDVWTLGEKSVAALNRIYEVASRLSGMTDEDVEELAENFGSRNGTGSSSPSPKGSAKPSKNS